MGCDLQAALPDFKAMSPREALQEVINAIESGERVDGGYKQQFGNAFIQSLKATLEKLDIRIESTVPLADEPTSILDWIRWFRACTNAGLSESKRAWELRREGKLSDEELKRLMGV